MAATPTLELRAVRKAYGDFIAVDDVSFAVRSGTIFGLLGPNGAGKTTTLRMIMDIIAPDSGQVLFQGEPRSSEDMQRIGYLPEERGLYRKMTVTDLLLFIAELHGTKEAPGAAQDRGVAGASRPGRVVQEEGRRALQGQCSRRSSLSAPYCTSRIC